MTPQNRHHHRHLPLAPDLLHRHLHQRRPLLHLLGFGKLSQKVEFRRILEGGEGGLPLFRQHFEST